MKIKTTAIGAYPKPSCTPIGDWFPDVEDQEAKGADKGLLQRWSINDLSLIHISEPTRPY